MSSSKKLLLFLLLVPWILAEVLSWNTLVISYLTSIDLIFLVLAYGVPILLIREFRVWYKISYFWLFLLGLAYGIFNEWFLAKTILDSSLIPVWGFQNFWLFAGLNISWGLMIIPWHAFFSVIFPIVFAEHLFPQHKTISLISKKWALFFLFVIYIGLVILSKNWLGTISPFLLTIFYLVSFLLIYISKQFQQISWNGQLISKKSYLIGCLTIWIYLFFFLFASTINFWVYASTGIILWIVIVWYFLRLTELQIVRFWIWSYLTFWAFATIVSIWNWRIDLLIAYPIIIIIMHYFLLKKTPISWVCPKNT